MILSQLCLHTQDVTAATVTLVQLTRGKVSLSNLCSSYNRQNKVIAAAHGTEVKPRPVLG